MAIKRLIEIKVNPNDYCGEMFDLWEFRSIQRGERYNEERNEMDYLILVNKNAIGTNYNDLEIVFNSREERDDEMTRIKTILEEDEDILIL